MLWFLRKSNSKNNHKNFAFLYYRLDYSIILVCAGISLKSLNSPGSQLSFNVLWVKNYAV